MDGLLPEIALKTLADDMACDVGDLLADGNRVTLQESRPLRRHFPLREPGFEAITLGRGSIIRVDPSLLAWAQQTVLPLTSRDLFGATGLHLVHSKLTEHGQGCFGPSPVYLCHTARRWPLPASLELRRLEGNAISSLYVHEELKMALSYYTSGDRPDVLAAAAYCGDHLAGVAACSADSDAMWQVGIDVLPHYRGRGVAKALVSDLTAWILDVGKVPYYCTGMSNLASQRIAIATGYYPAWTVLSSR